MHNTLSAAGKDSQALAQSQHHGPMHRQTRGCLRMADPSVLLTDPSDVSDTHQAPGPWPPITLTETLWALRACLLLTTVTASFSSDSPKTMINRTSLTWTSSNTARTATGSTAAMRLPNSRKSRSPVFRSPAGQTGCRLECNGGPCPGQKPGSQGRSLPPSSNLTAPGRSGGTPVVPLAMASDGAGNPQGQPEEAHGQTCPGCQGTWVLTGLHCLSWAGSEPPPLGAKVQG